MSIDEYFFLFCQNVDSAMWEACGSSQARGMQPEDGIHLIGPNITYTLLLTMKDLT